MDERDKQMINERYTKRLQQYGDDIKTMASGTIERRRVRFDVLSQVGDMNGASVLDIGCGFADYYQYLKDRGIKAKYTGYDINEELIRICREKYPEASFEVKDVQNDRIDKKYDFVISSQTFNNKLQYDDNEKVIRDVLKKAYDICTDRGGVAIDMITSYVDFKEEKLHYYKPEEIFSYCKALTKRVVLRHDYPLFEFVVYIYKDFKGWRKNAAK
jgi:SAM-dependent methyltransferase